MNPNTDLHKHLAPGSEKLKVLHIGNIANNGYNIANLFNQAGMQSDLIIGPYYHIAGCPEWEDAEFIGDIGDQFYPAWHKVKITNGFKRPKWAAQGPWETCIKYLLHRNRGNRLRAGFYWHWLSFCRWLSTHDNDEYLKVSTVVGNPSKVIGKLKLLSLKATSKATSFTAILTIKLRYLAYMSIYKLRYWAHMFIYLLRNLAFKLRYWAHMFIYLLRNLLFKPRYWAYMLRYYIRQFFLKGLKKLLLSNNVTKPLFYQLRSFRRKLIGFEEQKATESDDDVAPKNIKGINLDRSRASNKIEQKSEQAHESSDLTESQNLDEYDVSNEELESHMVLVDKLKPLFDYYDVIVGYSTDGIWPLLANKKYVAYEHGTIRTIPFEDNLQGRICKLVYQEADQVIISNFDNNLAAQRLGLKRFTCIPHYINEMIVNSATSKEIRAKYEGDFDTNYIIYNPSRQHWSVDRDAGWEKGNDIFIKGFAEFVKKVNPKALAIMTHWGESLPMSKNLIKKLGIEDNVDWIEPVPHKQMIQYIQASDIVSDQFLLETFGGIPAKAFMHGKPVLSSFNPKIHEWCFDSMPPFLPARTANDIFNSLKKCYKNNEYYEEIASKSVVWYEKEHSNTVLLARMSQVIKDCFNGDMSNL